MLFLPNTVFRLTRAEGDAMRLPTRRRQQSSRRYVYTARHEARRPGDRKAV
jgi:hypothetical protein